MEAYEWEIEACDEDYKDFPKEVKDSIRRSKADGYKVRVYWAIDHWVIEHKSTAKSEELFAKKKEEGRQKHIAMLRRKAMWLRWRVNFKRHLI